MEIDSEGDTIEVEARREVAIRSQSKRGEAAANPGMPSPEKGGTEERVEEAEGGPAWSIAARRTRGRPAGVTKKAQTKIQVVAGGNERAMDALIQEMGAITRLISSLQDELQATKDGYRTALEDNKRLYERMTTLEAKQEAGFTAQKTASDGLLEALTRDTIARSTAYSAAAARGLSQHPTQTCGAGSQRPALPGGPKPPPNKFQDGRAVIINMAVTKIDRTDYSNIRDRLQHGLNAYGTTKDLKITGLRPGPFEKIDVLFQTEEQAETAKKHTAWVAKAIPAARIQQAQWSPIKIDGVPKTIVLEDTHSNKIQESFANAFKKANDEEGLDATVVQARWLSAPNPLKKLGSMVIWLKNASTAAHLLQKAVAQLGAIELQCSHFISKNDKLPCFNCGDYQHKQSACKNQRKCAICSGSHFWRECKNKDKPKCSACNGPHAALSHKCKLHPEHKAFLARQRMEANAAGVQPLERPVSSVQTPGIGKAPAKEPQTARTQRHLRDTTTEMEVEMTGPQHTVTC